ncbi:hypothetical protein BJF79_37990 [Actinomadura sp. CNU-125]|nr:hypothetical protein BJF79_37990 [Actinomadura sp. CNU-125]
MFAVVLALTAACGTEVRTAPAADGAAPAPSSGSPSPLVSPLPPLRGPRVARTECSPDASGSKHSNRTRRWGCAACG